MTDKHPTDALPMPAKHRTTFPLGGGNEASIDYFTADQLRAERIAAYDTGLKAGRESMREEAEKKLSELISKCKTQQSQKTLRGAQDAIRSIEL